MKAQFTRVAPYAGDAMNLPVENLEAAIPFYEETLGFYVVSRQDAPHKSVSARRGASKAQRLSFSRAVT